MLEFISHLVSLGIGFLQFLYMYENGARGWAVVGFVAMYLLVLMVIDFLVTIITE